MKKPKQKILTFTVASLFFLPPLAYAQALTPVTDMSAVPATFIKVVDWVLFAAFLLGLLFLPYSFFQWYKKNSGTNANSGFFRSGPFIARVVLIVIIFVTWKFKVVDAILGHLWS